METVGGLPLGFGGGAPLKNAEIDPNKPPEALRGLRLRVDERVLFLIFLLPGGRPRLAGLREDEAYLRVFFLAPGLRCRLVVFSVIFGIIAQMVSPTLYRHLSVK